MVRFRTGDRKAFAVLVRRHQRSLYHFALRHLRSPTQAEDVVQEAFARVVQNATEFKHEAKFLTWLFAITRNLCIDQLRKNSYRRHPSLDQPVGASDDDGPSLGERIADPSTDTERRATARELQGRIAAAVDALPDEQREVFLLREVASLPFKDIATLTGTPENTVKSRMRYALERLQAALEEYEQLAREVGR
jgi:RNA polymerase sigma-70 factor (ECF subfamily)